MMNIILAVLLLAVSAPAFASSVAMQWDAVPEADGYRVYVDGQMAKAATSANTEITTTPGKHTIYVTAFNAWGESGPSNTVTTPAVAGIPAGVRLVITIDATK